VQTDAEVVPLVLWPLGHVVHDAAPAAENVLAIQAMHGYWFAPLVALYCPAGQATHSVRVMNMPAPEFSSLTRYRPASQLAQSATASFDVSVVHAARSLPAGQFLHAVIAFASAYLPAPHPLHAAIGGWSVAAVCSAPSVSTLLYLPRGHDSQPAAVKYWPLAQLAQALDEAPAANTMLAGHEVHAVEARIEALNLPDGHWSHAESVRALLAGRNCPAAQIVHVEPPR